MKIFGKIENGKIKLDNSKDYDDFVGTLKEGDYIELEIKRPINIRTSKQNAAMHKWYDLVSKALNDEGVDVRSFIKEGIDIMWTPYVVKEYLWRPMQEELFGKKSTKDLTTNEIDKIYEPINKVMGERTGIHVPFPSIDNLINYD